MLASWTAFVVMASLEGVFARLESEAYIALAAFVLAFMLGASRIDADAAALWRRMKRPLALALVLDILVIGASVAGALQPGSGSAFPGAFVMLVVLPVAFVLHAEALRRPRLRKAPGASPGARPAAT